MKKRKILIPLIMLSVVFIISISFTVMLVFRNHALEGAFKRNNYTFQNGKYTYKTSELINGTTNNFVYEYDTAVKVLKITQQTYVVEEGVAIIVMKNYYVHVQTGDFNAYYTLSTIPESSVKTEINTKGNVFKFKDNYTTHVQFKTFIEESTEYFFEIIDESWIPAFIYRL